jgi:2-C-methyl-D-erythritol 4-phosphate cytidylyltransferase
MRVCAILLAAGAGERLGAGMPKALCPLGDSTILEQAFASLSAHPDVGRIVITVPEAEAEAIAAAMHGRATVISGGRTRQDSVRLALGWLTRTLTVDGSDPSDDPQLVLVHDAARPFVPVAMIDRTLAALLAGADAAVPALAVTDTIKRIGPEGSVMGTLDRTELCAVQTPQGFRFDALVQAHRYARTAGIRDVSDDAALVERHGGRVVLVEGADEAFKITRPWDLRLAELLAAR